MQMTDITPYLPYYLGCEATLPYLADDEDWEDYFLESVSINGKCTVFNPRYGKSTHPANTIVPHLRPFADFTVDDLKGWYEKLKELGYPLGDEDYREYSIKELLQLYDEEITPHLIVYLCSREIDVFGLISAGLAKIKKEEGK